MSDNDSMTPLAAIMRVTCNYVLDHKLVKNQTIITIIMLNHAMSNGKLRLYIS